MSPLFIEDQSSVGYNKGVNFFFEYFVRGVLTIVPLALTWYILSLVIGWVDKLLGIEVIPGLGAVISVIFITLFGYGMGNIITRSFMDSIDNAISKIPGVGLIYGSIKEFTLAVVDKKMNFDRPVLIITNMDNRTQKIGFITNDDLEDLNLPGQVAVYVPQCYSFSGELFVIPKDHIIPIKDSCGSAMMKFVVSGGVIDLKSLKNLRD